MNPLCACACGCEVALPKNTWIMGHSALTNLQFSDLPKVKRCLRRGMPRKKIAAKFGIGCVTIEKIAWGMSDKKWAYIKSPTGLAIPPFRYVKPFDYGIWRQADIDKARTQGEERQWLRKGKATLREIKQLLKHPHPWQSPRAASQPGATSPTA